MNRAATFGIVIPAMLTMALGTALATDPPESSFLPLQPGNLWCYVAPGGNAMVRSTRWFDIQGYRVSRIDGFMFPLDSNELYLLTDRCQGVCELNRSVFNLQPAARMVSPADLTGLWYCCSHSIQEGQTVFTPPMVKDCVHGTRGVVVNKGGPVSVPAGDFPWSVTILYDLNPCTEVGIYSEVLVPDVGVVRRTVWTPEGWHTFQLDYAVINGRLIGSPFGRPETKPADLYTAPELTPTTWGAIKSAFTD